MLNTIPYGPMSGFSLNLLPLVFYCQAIILTNAIMQEKQKKTHILNKMTT